MCGIALLMSSSGAFKEGTKLDCDVWTSLCAVCADRGPDWSNQIQLDLADTQQHTKWNLSIYASVLHLRGLDGLDFLTRQPHVGRDGSVFVWNGEIFEGLSVDNNENDGSKLFDLIQETEGNTTALVNILSQVEGPYAFVYFNKPSQTLHFARDPLGRRSLLMHIPTTSEPFLAICSSSSKDTNVLFEEVSTAGVYSMMVGCDTTPEFSRIQCTPRGDSVFAGQMVLNREIPQDPSSIISPSQIHTFIEKLDESVRIRVSNIPSNNAGNLRGASPISRLGVLFSGGIDCSVLAFLADRHIPHNEPIDLLNVAFENPRTLNASNKGVIQDQRAQRKRSKKERKEGAPIAICDNTTVVVEETSNSGAYNVPDRLTGLEEVEELRRLCPHRQWNFVCVDVPYEECKREEHRVISLMYPSKTVMDLSLALALYFASRGKGYLDASINSTEKNEYITPARVLLSGLGSDELLGGYSRHKHAYSRDGWAGLINELQLDLDRLPTRNLGRDDRVISTHGRESRYPFLSLSLVSYLVRLPVQVKLDPRLTGEAVGMGDKTLLRLAAERLGLVLACRRVKRAMQFGSRSARMEGGTTGKKGHFDIE